MKNRDAALAFDGAERISEGDAEAFKCAGCGASALLKGGKCRV